MENFYCKRCGRKASSIRNLVAQSCQRHPDGSYKGKCELYEGEEKDEYTCKRCGRRARTIANLTAQSCQRHPDGSYKGKCTPAL